MSFKKKKLQRSIFVLSIAGLLFSGYLSGIKFFSGTCSFNETCPYVLGYPACYYGFFMFLVLFGSSLLMILKKYKENILHKTIWGVSLAGILFAGFLSIQELFFSSCPEGGCNYGLGLPTCAYGFVVYVTIFVLSSIILCSKK